jgi:hypothetical protein
MGERDLDRPLFREQSRVLERPRLGRSGGNEDADSQHRRDGRACKSQRLRVGPNDQSLLPTKLIGVTSTMAIAWAAISGSPARTST